MDQSSVSELKEGGAACAPYVKSLSIVTEHSEPIGQGLGTGNRKWETGNHFVLISVSPHSLWSQKERDDGSCSFSVNKEPGGKAYGEGFRVSVPGAVRTVRSGVEGSIVRGMTVGGGGVGCEVGAGGGISRRVVVGRGIAIGG